MVKNLPANSRDLRSMPGLGRTPEGGNGNPLLFLPEKSHGQRSPVGLRTKSCELVAVGQYKWSKADVFWSTF